MPSKEVRSQLKSPICPPISENYQIAKDLIPTHAGAWDYIQTRGEDTLLIKPYRDGPLIPYGPTDTNKLFRINPKTKDPEPISDIPIWGFGTFAVSGDIVWYSGRTHAKELLQQKGIIKFADGGGAYSFLQLLKYNKASDRYETYDDERLNYLQSLVDRIEAEPKKSYIKLLDASRNGTLFLSKENPKEIIVVSPVEHSVRISVQSAPWFRDTYAHPEKSEIIISDEKYSSETPLKLTKVEYGAALKSGNSSLIQKSGITRDEINCIF